MNKYTPRTLVCRRKVADICSTAMLSPLSTYRIFHPHYSSWLRSNTWSLVKMESCKYHTDDVTRHMNPKTCVTRSRVAFNTICLAAVEEKRLQIKGNRGINCCMTHHKYLPLATTAFHERGIIQQGYFKVCRKSY